jgi:hypothetical protein
MLAAHAADSIGSRFVGTLCPACAAQCDAGTKKNMNGSPPPKPAVMASLVVLIVELPAFIMFLLIRWTPNYGPEWHNWPVLAGLFPTLFATDKLNLLPANPQKRSRQSR